ncbi:cytochrome P450 [Peniophora sp. CONT]|nr:cytochrome P450 [Peniophora sp. CONT]
MPSATYSTVISSFVKIIGLWAAYRLYQRWRHVFALSFLPGPPTASYVWGDMFDLKKAPVGTRYNFWRKAYGPVYRLREPLMEPVLVMGDPKGALHVLNKTSVYWRPEIDRVILGLWFGPSVLSTEADAHAQRRRKLNPAFTPQSIKQVSPVLQDLAHTLVDEWNDKLGTDDSLVLNVSEALHRFALNAISRTMFAYDLSDPTGSIPTLLKNISDGPDGPDTTLTRVAAVVIGTFPKLMGLPNPMKTWATMLQTELGKIAGEVWGSVERIGTLEGMDARALEVLSQANKSGDTVSKDDAVAEIIGLLFAGSETVANVMGELLYELAQQPVIQTRMRDELRAFEALNGGPPGYVDLSASNKNGLEYFNAVIMETLRCKAVLMDIAREAIVDDAIPLSNPLPGTNEHVLHVRKGQIVSIPVRDGLNVDTSIWGDDAEAFRPERWLDGNAVVPGVGPGGVLTFGDGAKSCIGRHFAMTELKIVASTLLRSFSFHPSETEPDIDFYHLGGNTVKPKIRGSEGEGVQLPLRVRRA